MAGMDGYNVDATLVPNCDGTKMGMPSFVCKVVNESLIFVIFFWGGGCMLFYGICCGKMRNLVNHILFVFLVVGVMVEVARWGRMMFGFLRA